MRRQRSNVSQPRNQTTKRMLATLSVFVLLGVIAPSGSAAEIDTGVSVFDERPNPETGEMWGLNSADEEKIGDLDDLKELVPGDEPPETTSQSASAACAIPGPDDGDYTCDTTGFNWLDMAGGTTLSLGDDSTRSVSLPFTYTWYGGAKTTAYVGSNGLICFTSVGCSTYTPSANPNTSSPNDYVACFWDDLNPSTGGTVKHKTFGTSPNRVFAVEFDNVPHYPSTGGNTFQFQLFETGEAKCMYDDVSPKNGSNILVGTENSLGTTGVRYKFAEFSATNEGVEFSQADVSAPSDAPQNLAASCGNPHGVKLDWSPTSDGTETSYKIYGGMSSNPSTVVDTVSASVTTYTHKPSWTTSSWHYRVSAVNSDGESPKSNEASKAPCDLQPPGSVSGLTSPSHSSLSSFYNDISVDGDWNSASDSYSGIAGYWFDVSTNPGSNGVGCSVKSSSTSGTSNAPGSAGEFYFRVVAVDNAGNCDPSAVTSRQVNVDTVVPTFFRHTPSDGATTGNPAACAVVEHTDNRGTDAILASATRVWVDGVDKTSSASKNQGSTSYCPTSWSQGSHTIEVWVKDDAVGADYAQTVWSFEYSASSGGGGGGHGGSGACFVENGSTSADGDCEDGTYNNSDVDMIADVATNNAIGNALLN